MIYKPCRRLNHGWQPVVHSGVWLAEQGLWKGCWKKSFVSGC